MSSLTELAAKEPIKSKKSYLEMNKEELIAEKRSILETQENIDRMINLLTLEKENNIPYKYDIEYLNLSANLPSSFGQGDDDTIETDDNIGNISYTELTKIGLLLAMATKINSSSGGGKIDSLVGGSSQSDVNEKKVEKFESEYKNKPIQGIYDKSKLESEIKAWSSKKRKNTLGKIQVDIIKEYVGFVSAGLFENVPVNYNSDLTAIFSGNLSTVLKKNSTELNEVKLGNDKPIYEGTSVTVDTDKTYSKTRIKELKKDLNTLEIRVSKQKGEVDDTTINKYAEAKSEYDEAIGQIKEADENRKQFVENLKKKYEDELDKNKKEGNTKSKLITLESLMKEDDLPLKIYEFIQGDPDKPEQLSEEDKSVGRKILGIEESSGGGYRGGAAQDTSSQSTSKLTINGKSITSVLGDLGTMVKKLREYRKSIYKKKFKNDYLDDWLNILNKIPIDAVLEELIKRDICSYWIEQFKASKKQEDKEDAELEKMFKVKFGENTKVFGKENVGLFAGGLEKRMNKAGFSGLYKLLDSYIKKIDSKSKLNDKTRIQFLISLLDTKEGTTLDNIKKSILETIPGREELLIKFIEKEKEMNEGKTKDEKESEEEKAKADSIKQGKEISKDKSGKSKESSTKESSTKEPSTKESSTKESSTKEPSAKDSSTQEKQSGEISSKESSIDTQPNQPLDQPLQQDLPGQGLSEQDLSEQGLSEQGLSEQGLPGQISDIGADINQGNIDTLPIEYKSISVNTQPTEISTKESPQSPLSMQPSATLVGSEYKPETSDSVLDKRYISELQDQLRTTKNIDHSELLKVREELSKQNLTYEADKETADHIKEQNRMLLDLVNQLIEGNIKRGGVKRSNVKRSSVKRERVKRSSVKRERVKRTSRKGDNKKSMVSKKRRKPVKTSKKIRKIRK